MTVIWTRSFRRTLLKETSKQKLKTRFPNLKNMTLTLIPSEKFCLNWYYLELTFWVILAFKFLRKSLLSWYLLDKLDKFSTYTFYPSKNLSTSEKKIAHHLKDFYRYI